MGEEDEQDENGMKMRMASLWLRAMESGRLKAEESRTELIGGSSWVVLCSGGAVRRSWMTG